MENIIENFRKYKHFIYFKTTLGEKLANSTSPIGDGDIGQQPPAITIDDGTKQSLLENEESMF